MKKSFYFFSLFVCSFLLTSSASAQIHGGHNGFKTTQIINQCAFEAMPLPQATQPAFIDACLSSNGIILGGGGGDVQPRWVMQQDGFLEEGPAPSGEFMEEGPAPSGEILDEGPAPTGE